MPACLSALARATLMWPIDAQRLRLVCSATSRAPSSTFSKSRLERPWPWVTMQKRCAPAASAALACSSICSGSIIACSGVSASAKRDWAQNPQSSAQPPDFALTSEHMSPRILRPEGPGDGPIRFLLCDDVAAFRALVRYSLEDEPDIEVVGEAGDGLGGVRMAAELQPDVVLLDLSMPDCDGLEAIPALRRSVPHAAVVALSGFTADRMAQPVIASGAIAYLEKGVALGEIINAIRVAAAGTAEAA